MNHSAIPLREIGLLCLAALAVFLLLAMVSYSPEDAAFSYVAANGQPVHNLVGTTGAWSADVLLYALGRVAYLLPVVMLVVGVRLVRADFGETNWVIVGLRSLGWLCVIVCSCVVFATRSAGNLPMPSGAGGVIGAWALHAGVPVFGYIGLGILAVTGVVIGLQAAVGFSWLQAAEQTGRAIHWGTAWVVERILAVADVFRARRAERARSAELVRERSMARDKAARTKRSRASKGVTVTQPKPPEPAQAQQTLFTAPPTGSLPSLDLLDAVSAGRKGYSEESLSEISKLLELKLQDFGVDAEVVSVLPGPVVTRFELQPAAGVKVQKISALAKDLARSLAVVSVRIVEIIPGKSVVGIEIPNEHREIVRLKEVLSTSTFSKAKSPLTLALGKDIAGEPIVADVSKMPHLLVAGTTGSGKSVGVNAMLLSILCKATPEEVRLILVDPKMLELSVYEGIPHLLTPVVTDMKEAAHALNWCVAEMERRYRLMASMGVRNLAGFNSHIRKSNEPIFDPTANIAPGETPPELAPLPVIVVVIDEFADMMMIVGKKVEQLIARIAQKARAAGIHLVLATQRPSVDVITGLIKANIPARISFQVSSKVDSRTILDQGGAEQLLGHGDMLYLPPGVGLPVRVHGAFVSDDEVHRVVADWKQRGEPDYLEDVVRGGDAEPFVEIESNGSGSAEDSDPLYDEAVEFVLSSRKASISSVQRKLRVGYNRAARLIEAMEEAGVVSEMSSNGGREVLVPSRGE